VALNYSRVRTPCSDSKHIGRRFWRITWFWAREDLGCDHPRPEVVWALHGYATLHGKAAFATELQHDDPTAAAPRITLDRLVDEGDTVAVMGHLAPRHLPH
jgi:hypothetical protein